MLSTLVSLYKLLGTGNFFKVLLLLLKAIFCLISLMTLPVPNHRNAEEKEVCFMFTALRDLFYNLFPINLPGIWWILSERWFL